MEWIKAIPPKMAHDKLGVYSGLWMPEMDRCWMSRDNRFTVCSRLLNTQVGKVEHVTITRNSKFSADGSGDVTWAEKMEIKNDLFGEDRFAIEVFPKARYLVDVCDVYHLWVFDKKLEMPFGIHPKEFKKAINRGYSMTAAELQDLKAFVEERGY